jgi:deoxyribodipyrimidine photo-lyase
VRRIQPDQYAATRNFGDGAVTHLSPYISRGVISTRDVYEHLTTLDLPWQKIEKLVQELAWRDYWQQVWVAQGEAIHSDLKNPQTPVSNHHIPTAVIKASTGIHAVDNAIRELYQTGYMHNHMRMYVASICCNVAHSHWLTPARWMYAHLLDGDLASNQLSWQWVAGSFSNKKYYANQDNINKYFHDSQKHTFLDVEYAQFNTLAIPDALSETVPFSLATQLPHINRPTLQNDKVTLIYNYYNLDPTWHQSEDVQRLLLLEPTIFSKYPVKPYCIDFALNLAKNINGIEVFVGEFDDLLKMVDQEHLHFKEHPLNRHYKGHEETRKWLSHVTGYFPSFFAYWKKIKKELM